MKHFNMLSPAELERLAMIAEEAGEIVQAVNKIIRHGYDNYHPDAPTTSNRASLAMEIGNFQRVVQLASDAGDLDKIAERAGYMNKTASLRHYCHHQPAALLWPNA